MALQQGTEVSEGFSGWSHLISGDKEKVINATYVSMRCGVTHLATYKHMCCTHDKLIVH